MTDDDDAWAVCESCNGDGDQLVGDHYEPCWGCDGVGIIPAPADLAEPRSVSPRMRDRLPGVCVGDLT